jgi:hypothetical protein
MQKTAAPETFIDRALHTRITDAVQTALQHTPSRNITAYGTADGGKVRDALYGHKDDPAHQWQLHQGDGGAGSSGPFSRADYMRVTDGSATSSIGVAAIGDDRTIWFFAGFEEEGTIEDMVGALERLADASREGRITEEN